MHPGKILALDYGAKNVGIAHSDELGLTVQPLPSLPQKSRRGFLQNLGRIIQERGIRCIVVGMPVNMDGSAGAAAERVGHFIQALRREIGLPVIAVDERLSTVEAEGGWRAMSRRQRLKYRTVDSLAAAIILQRHLEES